MNQAPRNPSNPGTQTHWNLRTKKSQFDIYITQRALNSALLGFRVSLVSGLLGFCRSGFRVAWIPGCLVLLLILAMNGAKLAMNGAVLIMIIKSIRRQCTFSRLV